MLQGAAAANAEIWANRSDTLGARLVDIEKMPPVRVAGNAFDLDRLARQRIGHVDRAGWAIRDPIAATAQTIDHKSLNHARPQ
jgi:hypothetical protein